MRGMIDVAGGWSLTCSGLFCLMRKRGVSGRKNRPMTMIRLHANWMAIGMR
jgi:hypothetical protein